jgi:hypothetical protein
VGCDTPGSSLYGTPALFHGQDLQSIKRIRGRSEIGLRAELYGSSALGWERPDGLLDLAALDGGLQLALAWFFEKSGSAMLPTSVGHVQIEATTQRNETSECSLTVRSQDALHGVCDIEITGDLWRARLWDVQLHARVQTPKEARVV